MQEIERRPGLLGRFALALRGGGPRSWDHNSARAGGGASGDGLPPPAGWIDLVAERSPDALGYGVWPTDPDLVPYWRLADERRALDAGYTLPGYRTRREFDAAVARCVAALQPDAAPVLPPAPVEMSIDDAARSFVAWIRVAGRGLEFTADRLTEVYHEHCAEIGCRAHPENMLRDAMLALDDGVTRRQQSMGKIGSRRLRPTVWTISPNRETETVSRQFRRAA